LPIMDIHRRKSTAYSHRLPVEAACPHRPPFTAVRHTTTPITMRLATRRRHRSLPPMGHKIDGAVPRRRRRRDLTTIGMRRKHRWSTPTNTRVSYRRPHPS
jgi:hypothetical protein